jgi:lipoic acid synthetase
MTKPPSWLRVRVARGAREAREAVRSTLAELGVETVCQQARCPNQGACWGARTATFMVLGARCTRSCRFCAVETGDPGGVLDPTEPDRVARAAKALALRHVVLTSVDRDDLPDGGAEAFRRVTEAIRRELPSATIEALVPDFGAEPAALGTMADAPVDVLGHNLETVRRCTPAVRDRRAGYDRSLEVLCALRLRAPTSVILKSSLMLGLGETDEEVEQALRDLRAVPVDVVTVGQYLRPNPSCAPVARYVSPEGFARFEAFALGLGFDAALAGPLVRSSYLAGELLAQCARCAGSSS